MPQQERFQLYPGFPSEREKLQALEDFLHWLYAAYVTPDQFLRDFHVLLRGLRVGEKLHPGGQALLDFLGTLKPDQLRWLQRDAHDIFDRSVPIPGFPHSSFSQPKKIVAPMTGVQRIVAGHEGLGAGQDHFQFIYYLDNYLTLEALKDMVVVQVYEYLDGLNKDALVRCTACGHITLRRHPRGKMFCSPQCRWRTAAATKTQQAATQKTQKRGARKEGKEK